MEASRLKGSHVLFTVSLGIGRGSEDAQEAEHGRELQGASAKGQGAFAVLMQHRGEEGQGEWLRGFCWFIIWSGMHSCC
jgi:hypothetical protein